MNYDAILDELNKKFEVGNIKLENIISILQKNKVDDIFSFVSFACQNSPLFDKYLNTQLKGKRKYNEDEIYKKFGEEQGSIIFAYATIKEMITETNFDYSYETSKDLYADSLFFSDIREIPLMEKKTTISYIEKFQEYKNLFINELDVNKKKEYEKKYIFYQNQIIEGNIKLVVSIANKKKSQNIEVIELVNEGVIGLIRAIEKYDVTLGFAFSTYATYWIRQSINRAIEEKGRTIRVSSHQYARYNKYLNAVKDLTFQLNREPTIEELSQYLGTTPSKLSSLIITFSDTPSLDYSPKDEDDEDKTNMFNYLKSGEFEDTIINSELANDLVACLNEQEKFIIKSRFVDNLTLDDIGAILGLTRERIRQKEKKALIKMNNLSKVVKNSFLDYIQIPNEEIIKIVASLSDEEKKLIYKEFGYSLSKKTVPSKFQIKEIQAIILKIYDLYDEKIGKVKEYKQKKTLYDLLNDCFIDTEEYFITNKRIKSIWESQEKNTIIYNIMIKAFGLNADKLYDESLFTLQENNLIKNKLEKWKFKLKKWPVICNAYQGKTIYEILNDYNIDSEEYKEANKRINYLIENIDKTTLIYKLLVQVFGIDFQNKYDCKDLSLREISTIEQKLIVWKQKIRKPNFWPKKLEIKDNKHTYDKKSLDELLQVTKDELDIIIPSLNKETVFYKTIINCFGPSLTGKLNIKTINQKDLKVLYANIPVLRKKVNDQTPFLRKYIYEILECDINLYPDLFNDYILTKAFGPNLDKPYLNTLNVNEGKTLLIILKEYKKKIMNNEIFKKENIPEENMVLMSIVNLMSEDLIEPFILYFGLKDGIRYSDEDIALHLNINLTKVRILLQKAISFVKDTLEIYKKNIDMNFTINDEILKLLK